MIRKEETMAFRMKNGKMVYNKRTITCVANGICNRSNRDGLPQPKDHKREVILFMVFIVTMIIGVCVMVALR